jgi:hypothetical protein
MIQLSETAQKREEIARHTTKGPMDLMAFVREASTPIEAMVGMHA